MARTDDRFKSEKAMEKTPDKKYSRWLTEINKAEKELAPFHKASQKVVRRYFDAGAPEESDSLGNRKFNIFTANVGIMKSVLYANIPSVTVSRRFEQFEDDAARVAAFMLENTVKQDMEETDCNFGETMRGAVEDRLVAGLGAAWLRLETEVEERVLETVENAETVYDVDDNGQAIPVDDTEPTTYEQITHQKVVIDHVHWTDFLYSPCRTWAERRWVGRRAYMTRDQLVERFGREVGSKITLDYVPDQKEKGNDNTPVNEVFQQAVIYEIWDRVNRRVVWLSKAYPDILDEQDDPLGLDDFDPCPKPLFALTTTSNCVPKSDFTIYQDQYNELDIVNARISLLVQALKVVGVYDASAKAVSRMLAEGCENTMIPVDSWAMFAEKGGIKGQVDWMPLDQIILALGYLRTAREDIKGQIYELTGISDIVRGDTKASETLGAQKIKTQFASTRIQSLQGDVARFAQGILRIKAEIIAKHFSEEMIVEQSNIAFSPDGQNPELVQSALQLIKDDEKFNFRLKIDADSLGQVDYAAQKEEKMQYTNAVATFLQSAATTLKAVPAAAPMLFQTLKFSMSGLRGASEMEGVIDQGIDMIMKDLMEQKQKAANMPNPEMLKMQQEAQLQAQKQQFEQQKELAAQQNSQLEREFEQSMLVKKQQMDEIAAQQKHQMELEKLTTQQQIDRERLMMEREKMMMEMQMERERFQQEMTLERERFQQEMALERERFVNQQQAAVTAANTSPDKKEAD